MKNIQLKMSTSPDNLPEWDSMSHIQIILAIESEIKKKFSTSDIAKIKDIKSLLDVANKKS